MLEQGSASGNWESIAMRRITYLLALVLVGVNLNIASSAPSAASVDCGLGMREAYHNPTYSWTATPRIEVAFDDVAQTCGINNFSVYIDGEDVTSQAWSYTNWWWTPQYVVVYDVPSWDPLTPGDHTVVVTLQENCCAAGLIGDAGYAAWTFTVGNSLAINPWERHNGNGTCTVWNDWDYDSQPDPNEHQVTTECPNPRTHTNPDGSVVLYDDRDNDRHKDAGEDIASATNGKTRRNLDGTCTVYDDRDGDGNLDAGERVADYPCPAPRMHTNPDGSMVLYDDRDGDNTYDPDEELVATPNGKVRRNLDGSCTLYNDGDGDGMADTGEHVTDFPCPDVHLRDNGDGTLSLYDDKNNNGAEDDGEAIASAGMRDADHDNMPDEWEGEICGPPGNRDFIDQWAPNLGSCPRGSDGTYRNYVAPDRFGGVNIPVGQTDGPDADLDGFADWTTIHRAKLILAPFEAGIVEMGPAPDVTLDTDTNDQDPNVPALARVTIPSPIVSGYTTGADTDDDGFPASVTLLRSYFTVDRRGVLHGGVQPLSSEPATSVTQTLDPLDDNPDVPVVSRVTTPVPLVTGHSSGADNDRDDFPTTVTLERTSFTFDRRYGSLTPTAAPPLTQTVDGNDNDPNVPVVAEVTLPVAVPVNIEYGSDADGDSVPNGASLVMVRYKYDRRDPTTLTPMQAPNQPLPLSDADDNDKNVPAQRVFSTKAPMGLQGVDRDGDRVPGHFEVTYFDMTLDTTTGGTNTGSHMETYVVEEDDGYRGAGPLNLDPHDSDRDDLPDEMEPILCSRQSDNRDADGVCPDEAKQNYEAPAGGTGWVNPWRRS